MRKILYRLINKLGYRIENREKLKNNDLRYLSKFNTTANTEILFKSRIYIQNLDKYFNDLKIEDHKEGFIVSFSEVKIYVESAEEFFIINEVFIENDYNFQTASKSIVIDIGANVGISSIFFSTFRNVDRIYAFEPVADTYQQAKYNFSLNEKISRVYSIENFGIGKNNRDETFMFNKFIKGNTGVRGILSASYANIDEVVERPVKIRAANEVFESIIQQNDNKKIIVKMDCEGAEYEIFENLESTGMLDKIDVFMIEWHDKGAEKIETTLIKAGFSLFSRRLAINAGMLYAIKN